MSQKNPTGAVASFSWSSRPIQTTAGILTDTTIYLWSRSILTEQDKYWLRISLQTHILTFLHCSLEQSTMISHHTKSHFSFLCRGNSVLLVKNEIETSAGRQGFIFFAKKRSINKTCERFWMKKDPEHWETWTFIPERKTNLWGVFNVLCLPWGQPLT